MEWNSVDTIWPISQCLIVMHERFLFILRLGLFFFVGLLVGGEPHLAVLRAVYYLQSVHSNLGNWFYREPGIECWSATCKWVPACCTISLTDLWVCLWTKVWIISRCLGLSLLQVKMNLSESKFTCSEDPIVNMHPVESSQIFDLL